MRGEAHGVDGWLPLLLRCTIQEQMQREQQQSGDMTRHWRIDSWFTFPIERVQCSSRSVQLALVVILICVLATLTQKQLQANLVISGVSVEHSCRCQRVLRVDAKVCQPLKMSAVTSVQVSRSAVICCSPYISILRRICSIASPVCSIISIMNVPITTTTVVEYIFSSQRRELNNSAQSILCFASREKRGNVLNKSHHFAHKCNRNTTLTQCAQENPQHQARG